MKRIVLFLLLTMAVAAGCTTNPTAPAESWNPMNSHADESLEASVGAPVTAVGLPDLRVENITRSAIRGPDGKYSMTFYVTVANRGTAASGSFVVASKGWGYASISTCTGLWQATNTTSGLGVGATRTVTIYGPGYVGPRVSPNIAFSITALADAYCAVRESNEGNNGLTRGLRAGS